MGRPTRDEWLQFVTDIAEAANAQAKRTAEKERARLAALSPEQRAREEREKQRRAEAEKQRREEDRYRRYHGWFSEWAKRASWKPSEFTLLLHGRNPEDEIDFGLIGKTEEQRTLERVARAIGVSLRVVEPGLLRVTEPKVRADDCMAWTVDGFEPHPYWRRALSERQTERPQATEAPRSTASATAGTQSKKEQRLEALRTFLADTEQRAAARGVTDWDRRRMPVTIKDFSEVFFRVTKLPSVKIDTLRKDVHACNAAFAQGTKHARNNVLYLLHFARR